MSRAAIIPLAFLFLASCAPHLTHCPDVIRQHVIVVDGQGQPHDPIDSGGQPLSIGEYRRQLAGIFNAMDDFHKTHPDGKILIFVHGGLNSLNDSLTSADSEMCHVMAAGYFPIYLDWNSDIGSTYAEHVALITQGYTDDTIVRKLFIPAYVLADLARALARIPIVWINQFSSDIEGVANGTANLSTNAKAASTTRPIDAADIQRWIAGPRGQALANVYRQLKLKESQDKPGERPKNIHIYIGPDLDVSPWHMAGLTAMYIVTSPFKLVLQPVIDWLGTPAWQVMSRRTLMAFDGQLGGNPSDPNLDPKRVGHRANRAKNAKDFSDTGAMEVFREQLENVTSRNNGQVYRITLVGHSMGTMVLNEWLRRDVLEEKNQTYANIVYMGAACSVRDFGRSVVPYLQIHASTPFYSLMLHPLAEVRERVRYADIPPRGSLLVWLDDFLTDPQTPLDRTFGRLDNIINATEVIPESIRGQITLKAFALAPDDVAALGPCQTDYGPQEHGQFRGRPYWRPDFWADQQPIVPPVQDSYKPSNSPETRPCPCTRQ